MYSPIKPVYACTVAFIQKHQMIIVTLEIMVLSQDEDDLNQILYPRFRPPQRHRT